MSAPRACGEATLLTAAAARKSPFHPLGSPPAESPGSAGVPGGGRGSSAPMTSKNGPNPAAESSIVAQSRTVSRTASRKTEPPGKGSSLPLDVACESSGLGSDCREGGPHRAANPSPTLPPEWIGHRAHFGRESRLWTHSAPSFPLSLPGLPSRRVRKGWKSKLRINRSPSNVLPHR